MQVFEHLARMRHQSTLGRYQRKEIVRKGFCQLGIARTDSFERIKKALTVQFVLGQLPAPVCSPQLQVVLLIERIVMLEGMEKRS